MNWITENWVTLAGAAVIVLENILPHTPMKANSTVQLVLGLVKMLLPKTGGAYVGVHLDKGFGDIGASHNEGSPVLHITDIHPALAKKALQGKSFDWHTIPAPWRHEMEIKGFHSAPWDEVKLYLRDA